MTNDELTTEEELLLLTRAAEAGAFDGCFERPTGDHAGIIGSVLVWRLAPRANAIALPICEAIIGRKSEGLATVAGLLGKRAADLFWEAALVARYRRK